MYAQIINGIVNLIGDKEVGLPLPQHYLNNNSGVLCVDIAKLEPKPKAGYFYNDGVFYSPEEWQEEMAVEEIN